MQEINRERLRFFPIPARLVPETARLELAREALPRHKSVRFFATARDLPREAFEMAARSFPTGRLVHEFSLASGDKIRIRLQEPSSAVSKRTIVHRGIKIAAFTSPRSKAARQFARALGSQSKSRSKRR